MATKPGSNIPSIADLAKYRVNRVGAEEANRQSLYDFTSYDGANGQTQLIFFQLPAGQNSKTNADTNMEAAGTLPNPKKFLLQSIEVHFYPGISPGLEGAAAAVTNFTNDVYTFFKSGYLQLYIGSKTYLTEAPLGRFPPKVRVTSEAAYATTVASAQNSMDIASMIGRPYHLDTPILLEPTQNFNVTLNWPVAVPLPSATNARIGVVLDGILYRLSQ